MKNQKAETLLLPSANYGFLRHLRHRPVLIIPIHKKAVSLFYEPAFFIFNGNVTYLF